MFEQFFNLLHTPFGRDIPANALYSTPKCDELHARLLYAAKARNFSVVTGDVGVGYDLNRVITRENYRHA